MITICNQSPLKKINEKLYKELAQNIWRYYKKDESDISITFVSLSHILELNQSYLRKQNPTDVISFNLGKGPDEKHVADIYICPEIARENAEHYGCTFDEEIARLVIHGVLHFVGFEDCTESQKQQMHQLENKFLEKYWH